MELQELVERIQRWKERTSPEQENQYMAETPEEGVPSLTEELSDFVEEVSGDELDGTAVDEVSVIPEFADEAEFAEEAEVANTAEVADAAEVAEETEVADAAEEEEAFD